MTAEMVRRCLKRRGGNIRRARERRRLGEGPKVVKRPLQEEGLPETEVRVERGEEQGESPARSSLAVQGDSRAALSWGRIAPLRRLR